MPASTRAWQSLAELRAERHARTFMVSQLPAIDPRVTALAAEGYQSRQIAMILRLPVLDVRLMLESAERAAETEVTTRVKRRRRA